MRESLQRKIGLDLFHDDRGVYPISANSSTPSNESLYLYREYSSSSVTVEMFTVSASHEEGKVVHSLSMVRSKVPLFEQQRHLSTSCEQLVNIRTSQKKGLQTLYRLERGDATFC